MFVIDRTAEDDAAEDWDVVAGALEVVTVEVEAVEPLLQPSVMVLAVVVAGELEVPTTRTPEGVVAAYLSNVACSLMRVWRRHLLSKSLRA